jgi:hypothetical protein
MAMGQAERDRYNMQRGGAAGLPYLIRSGQTAQQAQAEYAAQAGGGTVAATAPVMGSMAPGGGTPAVFNSGLAAPTPQTMPSDLSMNSIMQQYLNGMNEANAFNNTKENNALSAMSQLSGQYTGLYDKNLQSHNAASDQINQGEQAMHDEAMNALEGSGMQEKADIKSDYGARLASAQQNLRNLGLGATSIGATTEMGNLRDQTSELGRLNQRLNDQRLSATESLHGSAIAALQVQEAQRLGLAGTYAQGATGLGEKAVDIQTSRVDEAPDASLYAKLAQIYGAGGAGGSGFTGAGAATSTNTGGGFNHFSKVNDMDANRYDPTRSESWQQPAGVAGTVGATGDLGLGNPTHTSATQPISWDIGTEDQPMNPNGAGPEYDWIAGSGGGDLGGWDGGAGDRSVGVASRQVPSLLRPRKAAVRRLYA